MLAETTGSQTRQYLPGLAQYEAGAWAYQLPDGVGSVRQLVNSSRQLTLWQNYDPFGNPTQIIGSPASPFGYTGEQVDPTGLVFLRARYYNPVTGRFLTPDSLIPDPLSSQAWNRYAYAGNNPIRYTDPSGHCFIFAGLDTTLCLTAWAMIGLTAAGGTSIYLSQHQAEIKAALESIPTIPLPPFQLPGATLKEDINPCYEAGPNIGQLNTWQVLPFSLDTPPYFGPVRPGVSLERPSVLGNNVFLADSRSSVEIRRSIRSLEKQIAEHQRKIDQRIGFDPVSSDPVINQRAAEARLRHLQHEIEEFRRQIEQLAQELRSRGETP